ncbi:MAG TPA: hypothetical protein VFV87_07475 [Pirellulaceae bacterium]|nr:hypothetical protein [Pirellulaceae bacterium]
MSNWLSCHLLLVGPRPEIERFADAAVYKVPVADGEQESVPFALRAICPLPDVPDCGPTTTRRVREYCWSTDCDVTACGDVERGDTNTSDEADSTTEYRFWSASAPPIRAILTASKRFDLEFQLRWIDRLGQTTGGEVTIRAGRFVDEQASPQIEYLFLDGSELNRREAECAADYSVELCTDPGISSADKLMDALREQTHFHQL